MATIRRSGATLSAALLSATRLALAPASAAAQSRSPTHVACVGDSITAGSGASSTSTNYPADLQRLLGTATQVQNFGVSGATMLSTGSKPYVLEPQYATATAFVSNAGAGSVVDVVIMLGANDSKASNWTPDGGSSAKQYAADYAAMIDHFAVLPTHPTVYVVLPLAAFANTYGISGTVIAGEIIPILEQLALQKGVSTIDLHTPTAMHPEYLTDGVHPNDAGYQVVAQVIYDGLLLARDAGAEAGGSSDGGDDGGAISAEGGAPRSESGAPWPEGGTDEPEGGAAAVEAGGSRGGGSSGGATSDAGASSGAGVDSSGGCRVGGAGRAGRGELGLCLALALLAGRAMRRRRVWAWPRRATIE